MQFRNAWSVAKYQEEESCNEDTFGISLDKNVCALSDGASDSFDSAAWSRLLVANYLVDPHLSPEWVARVAKQYMQGFNRSALSWSAQGAFDRGSFATLLGMRVDEHQAVIEAIGDSIAVLVDHVNIVYSFPYTEYEQFTQFPLLISTRPELNLSLFEGEVGIWRAVIPIASLSRPAVFAMSDALGEWTLARGCDAIKALQPIKTQRQFEKLVVQERKQGRLRRDDTTLAVFR